jgi:hypothetical protein
MAIGRLIRRIFGGASNVGSSSRGSRGIKMPAPTVYSGNVMPSEPVTYRGPSPAELEDRAILKQAREIKDPFALPVPHMYSSSQTQPQPNRK